MANELKFLRGSYTKWSGLTKKDADSFYIVEHRNESNEFVKYDLYLGDKFLCDGVSKADLANAVTNLVNGAGEGYNTLKGLETKVKALETAVGTGGTVAAQITSAIQNLDSGASGKSADELVTVKVTEVNGMLDTVVVTTNDIASASGLTAEANTRKADDDAIIAKIGTVGTGTTVVGMISAEADRAVAAEASLQAQIGQAATGEIVATGLHKEIADVKDAYEKAINALTATVGGTAIAEGNHVAVQVVEENGKLKSLTVTENDIASASALTAEIGRATSAENALDSRLDTIEGDEQTVGSIKKAVADAKKAIEGTFKDGDARTLADLNTKIETKTYSIAKATDEEVGKLGTNVKEAYKLIDEDSKPSGAFIPVYKDSSLKSVALDGQILKFTYILADGSEDTVGVDVSTFLAESEFANGLQVVDHVVSVKRDATSEGFLTVGADGIKLSGVQSAIDTAKKAVTDRLDKIEGSGEGSIKKALADAKAYTNTKITEEETARTNAVETAKSDLIGKATGDYNTLGKLEGKIKDAEAAAKAAATKLNKASDASHLTLNSVSGTSGEITYTIGESDIASANELDALKDAVGTGFTSASTVANHIAVLEGVTVTGKNAIVVSASGATENKEVSLKLGTQPSEGVAGVVLSQDANGLVAKLYWGTF